MKAVVSKVIFPIRRNIQPGRKIKAAVLGLTAIVALTNALRAGTLFVPNGSFESPVSNPFGIDIDSWQKQPQSPFFPTNMGPWETLMGEFANTDPTNFDHIDNMNGNQAAFIFPFPGAGLFQDFNSVDGTNTMPSHAFDSVFEVGRSYHLTTAFTSSTNEPLTNGASIEMSLYYRDVSNNIVTVAATNIVYDTNVFTNILHFLDFTVDVPTVNPADAWAGKNIGIELISTTFDPDLITGVWDVDNVRLTSTITVPNGSFESPVSNPFGIEVDSWEKQPQSPFFPTNMGPWETLMGEFANTGPTNLDHIDNMDGAQAAFVFPFPGAGFFQDFNSVGGTNTIPSHDFNVPLDTGKSYTLTTALTSSTDEPLTNGASIEISLYYRDSLSNMVVLAANDVVYDTNVFTNILHFLDFSATIPEVKATDPWAGKTVGINIESTTFDPDFITGVWDLDNVRLAEKVATALNSPVITNGQISFSLQSEPGLAFEILASTNVASLSASWSSIATFTNITGNFRFSDAAANHQRFYKARQLP
jgi:hypothetical protein